MTALSKHIYIDKLDVIVDQFNSQYHITIYPIDFNSYMYIYIYIDISIKNSC